MYFTKSLCILVVLLGALEVWSVQGMPYRQIVRPTKTIGTTRHIEAAHLQEETPHYSQQQLAGISDNYQQSTASPAHYTLSSPQNYQTQSNDYQWPQYPQPYPQPIVVDQYDNRYPDGSYEYRYELSDGTARYECGYFILHDYKKILIVKGYYSYRLPDKRYHTVFYSADQNGYHVESSYFSHEPPILPNSLSEDLINESGLRNYEATPAAPAETIHVSE